MVTKRARLWLTRGTTIGALVVAVVLGAATWVQGASIADDWLSVERRSDFGSAVLEEIGADSITLSSGEGLDRPGIWGLRGRDGFLRVGVVLDRGEDGVRRSLLSSSGSIRPGAGVRFERTAYRVDDVPVVLQDVVINGPLGEQAAWLGEGDDDTWVVFVHGNGDDRTQALNLLPAVAAEGFPVLVPTYRNDLGAPASRGGHHGLGRDEWRDIDAALRFAFASGAGDVVLVGFGSGGSIVGTVLYESDLADRVGAVVLDAPVLSLGMSVDDAWAPAQVPGFIVGWSKALATFRYGVDWAALDHVRRVDEWEPPVLILHGRDDSEAPLRASAEFAIARIDATLLLTFPQAGHGTSWNTDPDRYEQAVVGFLAEHAAGASSLDPVE